MPFYEYECQKCGHQLELMQKLSDAPVRKCPACGKQALRKLISSPVFRLKGSGWYETDFKSDREGKRNLADRPEKEETAPAKAEDKTATATADAPASPAKAEAKAESKVEAKSETSPKPAAEARPKPAPRSTRKRGARQHK